MRVEQIMNREVDSDHATEPKYRDLFNRAPFLITLTRMSDGTILDINEEWSRVLGYSKAEVIGKTAVELGIINDLDRRKKLYADLNQHGTVRNFEYSVTTRAGKKLTLSGNVEKVVVSGVELMLSALNDISDRKHFEEELKIYQEKLEELVAERTSELQKANRFLDSVVENIPDMIFVKDAKDLRFVRFNKAGEELLGYKQRDLLGKNDYDLFPKSEADFFIAKDRSVLANGSILDIPEEPIQTRLKGERYLHTKKIPIYGTNREPEYLLGISEDITERKMSEKTRVELIQTQIAKEEAQKGVVLRDDFISIASHELRTPLTALRIQFQMIPRVLKDLDFSGKDKLFELIKKSLHQLDQFSNLTDELLDVSRISSGHLVLKFEPVSLSSLVSAVLEQYSSEVLDAGCSVSTKLDHSIQSVWDPNRITQVIVNLLTNAIKYGAGKPIEFETKTESGHAKIIVKDQGIGIERHNLEKIFERFERVVPVTRFRGLGLGLYITKQIVIAHGGTIEAESEIGNGSTFTVTLPISPVTVTS